MLVLCESQLMVREVTSGPFAGAFGGGEGGDDGCDGGSEVTVGSSSRTVGFVKSPTTSTNLSKSLA